MWSFYTVEDYRTADWGWLCCGLGGEKGAACRGRLGPLILFFLLVESQVLSQQCHGCDYSISKSTWRTSGLRCCKKKRRTQLQGNLRHEFAVQTDFRKISSTGNGERWFYYLEFFLQAVHLGPQGVNDVLSVFKHEVFQLLGGLHQLNVLQEEKEKTEALKLLEKRQFQQVQQIYGPTWKRQKSLHPNSLSKDAHSLSADAGNEK